MCVLFCYLLSSTSSVGFFQRAARRKRPIRINVVLKPGEHRLVQLVIKAVMEFARRDNNHVLCLLTRLCLL